MTFETIITQSLALCCNTYCAFTKNKQRVYIATMLFNIFCLLTGFFQHNYGLVISYCIICYRSIIMLMKNKIKKWYCIFPLTFIAMHIVFGIVTWTSFWDIIPIITPIITGCVLWYFNNLQIYRCNNIVNSMLWMIHNIYSQSYILVVVRIYTIVVNIFALIKNKKKKR